LDIVASVAKIALTVSLSVTFATIAYNHRKRLVAYRQISWLLMIQCLLVIVGVVVVATTLMVWLPTPMSWSWLSLFGSSGTNLNTVGSTIPYYGIVFCAVLFLALPELARIEEEMFRKGTTSWLNALKRSTVFGLTHMLSGVSLGIAIGLIVAGLFFSHKYFKGGVELSTQAHFQYNVIAISLLTVSAIIMVF